MAIWIVECSVCGQTFEVEQAAMPVYSYTIPAHDMRRRDNDQVVAGAPCLGIGTTGIAKGEKDA